MPPPRPLIPVSGFIGEGGRVRLPHLDRDQPSDENGDWHQGTFKSPAWTPLGFLRRGEGYWLSCVCGVKREAPLQRAVDKGLGDRPMHTLTWKCEGCGGTEITASLG